LDEVDKVDVLAELQALRQRVAEFEERVESPPPLEEGSTRRGMLRLAGAAVVGGAAASLVSAHPAAAVSGTMMFGASNNAGTDSTTLTSSDDVTTLDAVNTLTTGIPDAVRGTATADGTGVHGLIDAGGSGGAYGVWGDVSGGAGIALVGEGGRSQLQLVPFGGGGFPTGFHFAGEVVANADGVFYCVATGTPGTWRKLAGPASAGAFHAVTPTRVYDSRAPLPHTGIIMSLATFNTRTLSVADGRDGSGNVTVPNLVPAGATAVAANVTVTGTIGGFGYLAINPGGNFVEAGSTINWFADGQTLANGVILTLNNSRQITVICNGGGATQFLVDISGYYL
jgi:hypothetical protein